MQREERRISKSNPYFMVVIMACLLGMTCLSSCLNDDEDADVVKSIIVEVDSHPCTVYPPWGEPTPIPGMSIKEENAKEWEDVGQGRIEGFTYESGYFYTLSVRKTILANPPADGSDVRYQLIDVLKIEKDSSYKDD
ncbi:MAG: DUF4377 domain-containing protein [Bacteroidales bacterium]|nr:DUF4377 domain-containing protein [Bacteroidales bacterium]